MNMLCFARIDAYFFWPDILKNLSKHHSKPHHFIKLLKMEIGWMQKSKSPYEPGISPCLVQPKIFFIVLLCFAFLAGAIAETSHPLHMDNQNKSLNLS